MGGVEVVLRAVIGRVLRAVGCDLLSWSWLGPDALRRGFLGWVHRICNSEALFLLERKNLQQWRGAAEIDTLRFKGTGSDIRCVKKLVLVEVDYCGT